MAEVAESRGDDSGGALFELLGAMDGLSGDADVAFLLTANRVDLLERALVERPGRVDLAGGVWRPGPEGRAGCSSCAPPTCARADGGPGAARDGVETDDAGDSEDGFGA